MLASIVLCYGLTGLWNGQTAVHSAHGGVRLMTAQLFRRMLQADMGSVQSGKLFFMLPLSLSLGNFTWAAANSSSTFLF